MFEDMTLFGLLAKGGITMIFLVLFSVIALATIFERWWFLYWRTRHLQVEIQDLFFRIKRSLLKGMPTEAATICDNSKNLLSPIFKTGILECNSERSRIEEVMERTTEQSVRKLKKYLWILATIGTTAPFVGLFGTVLGIMRAFHDIAKHGSAGLGVVSAGIAEALITTAAGLAVAIVAVVAYNCFQARINDLYADMRFYIGEFLELLTSKGETK